MEKFVFNEKKKRTKWDLLLKKIDRLINQLVEKKKVNEYGFRI